MSYKAIITKVLIKPHPKADRLNLAEVAGHQLVCAKDSYSDGDLVIFFPEGGQLSHEMCYHNNLYRENKGENKDVGKYGYFDSNRRVKAIKLRGEKSEGFMLPLTGLTWTGVKPNSLRPGQLVDELESHKLCEKYITHATRQACVAGARKAQITVPNFAKVGDTEKFRYMMNSIPAGAIITLSEKIHGTSGRTAYLSLTKPLDLEYSWPMKLAAWFEGRTLPSTVTERYKSLVSGSRNNVVALGAQSEISRSDGTKVPLNYRQLIHNRFEGCLKLGESVYYEIVVCAENSLPDFRQSVPKDDITKPVRKKYGDKMMYRYGTEPASHRIFIYRITMQNEDGDQVQLGWNQMVGRAQQLGVEVAPQLDQFIYDGDLEALKNRISVLADGPSTLDSSHIREGVAVHIDHPKMSKVLKYKGFVFCHLEGIAKNDENYVDPEEIA